MNRRAAPANVQAQLAMLKSSLHGHANKLTTSSPPPFTRRPYNTITIQTTIPHGDSLIVVRLEDIMEATLQQLGLALDQSIYVKIKRIDLWTEEPMQRITPTVRASFYGLNMTFNTAAAVTPVSAALKELEDVGTLGASAAVVSYSWPRDQQDIPLSLTASTTSGTSMPIYDLIESSEGVVYARYHLLWNTGNSVTPPPTN